MGKACKKFTSFSLQLNPYEADSRDCFERAASRMPSRVSKGATFLILGTPLAINRA